MATESAVAVGAPASSQVVEKGLKTGAIGYLSNLVIGIASTAPAYSLAATVGGIVAVKSMGVHLPAIMLISFVPILLVAAGYRYFNKADPDAGTTFAWCTRAFGPGTGWVNGWAIFLADLIVMASLSKIAATYTFKLFDWEAGAKSVGWQIVGAVVWIVLMTWICYRGIELSARMQQFLLGAEILILGAFAIVALYKVYATNPHLTALVANEETGKSELVHYSSIKPSLGWFNPFGVPFSTLMDGILLAIFLYWGWDSGVAVNEESEDPAEGPGRAAVMSTIILVLIYLLVTTASQAYYGTEFLSGNGEDVLGALGGHVFGHTVNKLLILAVLSSAAASTQTTILPTARTTLSMAHWRAVPRKFGNVHKRYLTPTWATLSMGAASIVITVVLLLLSESVQADAITAIGFPVAFYYGFTGIACFWYYRHELTKSAHNLFFAGLAPLAGGLMLWFVGGYAAYEYSKVANVKSKPILGITLPIWMGIGGLVLGIVLMVVARFVYRPFFARKTEVAPPGVLERREHVHAHF